MNCETFQRLMLWSEDPQDVPGELQAHYDGCGACREWQSRLVQIEQNVGLLPVPASTGLPAFLERLQSEPPTLSEPETTEVNTEALTRPARQPERPRLRLRTFSLRQLGFPSQNPEVRRQQYVGIGVAASLLFFMVAGFALFRPGDQPPAVAQKPAPDPLVAGLMQSNLNLAVAETDQKRAEALVQMAGELRAEILSLPQAGATELLNDLWYQYRRLTDHLGEAKSMKLGEGIAARPAADAKRIQQLKRNRNLIVDLVDGGLQLSREDEPIKRANSCQNLARRLANEIRQAVNRRESARAAEMGQHLRDLLTGGIAQNVNIVRPKVQVGSMLERDMKQVGDWVTSVTSALEDQLASASPADADLRFTLDAIHGGRTEVEKAIKG